MPNWPLGEWGEREVDSPNWVFTSSRNAQMALSHDDLSGLKGGINNVSKDGGMCDYSPVSHQR
jgi:hypothetical protein